MTGAAPKDVLRQVSEVVRHGPLAAGVGDRLEPIGGGSGSGEAHDAKEEKCNLLTETIVF